MGSHNNENPFESFDFETFFGGQFPFKSLEELSTLNWIDRYVQNALHQAMNPNKKKDQGDLAPEIFETHDHVIIKVAIPETVHPRSLRVLANAYRLRLDGLPENKNQIIELPAHINFRNGKALVKERILQVKLRKEETTDSFHEIVVRYE